MRGALRALLALVLAAASTGYLGAEERITLADGGRVRTVTTFAPNVGAALSRLGVEIGPEDRVLPSPRSVPSRRIEVLRAKDVVVWLNGQRQATRVTGDSVGEVLRELAVDPRGAFVEPGLEAHVHPGEEIVVVQPGEVTVAYEGGGRVVATSALTVGSLLRQVGITLGPHDRVEPNIVAYPAAGSTVKVTRVREVMEKRSSPIPFKRVTRQTDSLELGARKIGASGVEGVRVRTYRMTYEDGRVKGRVLIGSEVARAPKDEVTLVGTRRPRFTPTGGSETGRATWFPATGLTAAHPTLPFGTVVKVTNLANGRHVTAVVRDRGPYWEGRIIDLSPVAFAELAPLARGVVDVKVEW